MNDSVTVSSGASSTPYGDQLAHAQALDAQDPLAAFRAEFAMPAPGGSEVAAYLAGNSLGLQPLQARRYIVFGLTNQEKPIRTGVKLTPADFTIDSLRRAGH